MAKWYGMIGFAETVDKGNGVYKNQIIEKPYYGNVLRHIENTQTASDKVIDDITLSNELSIVSDNYAISNFHFMKYAEFMGVKWKIKKVEVKYPRLIITLGGVYNG